jgi:oxygen-independent coproporphyrinogen-3 oxidase
VSFGIYIHYPYCLQRCSYCDFATYTADQTVSKEIYLKALKKEIVTLAPIYAPKHLTSVYFGGGTPSLMSLEDLSSLIFLIKNVGFTISDSTEITLEINPKTLDSDKITSLIQLGFNRFSVGAQSFNSSHLKSVNRIHSSEDTLETLSLLKQKKVTYSADLLFGLPHQTLGQLETDLQILCELKPPHISAYYLTVPNSHPLNQNRPTEEQQLLMFEKIQSVFAKAEYQQYEISNFAKEGHQSKHNNLYWDFSEYWSVGLSAHSFAPQVNSYGRRYWNPSQMKAYLDLIEDMEYKNAAGEHLPAHCKEDLKKHESITDYCHVRLRTEQGIDFKKFAQFFGDEICHKALDRIHQVQSEQLIEKNQQGHWTLTKKGRILSNLVFQKMTFLQEDLDV